MIYYWTIGHVLQEYNLFPDILKLVLNDKLSQPYSQDPVRGRAGVRSRLSLGQRKCGAVSPLDKESVFFCLVSLAPDQGHGQAVQIISTRDGGDQAEMVH